MEINFTRDEDGYVTNGKSFFHINSIVFLERIGDKELSVVLSYGIKITIAYTTNEGRDMHYDFFTKIMKENTSMYREERENDLKIREASLATQKRIIAEHIGVVK